MAVPLPFRTEWWTKAKLMYEMVHWRKRAILLETKMQWINKN